MITRREAIQKTAVFAAGSAAIRVLPALGAQTDTPSAPTGPFTLPPLTYPVDALEPHIDAQTMEIHHGKHHAAYVTNLNKAVAQVPDLAKKSIQDLLFGIDSVPDSIRTAVRNNGGGHYNHNLFWRMMKKNGGGEPKGDLVKAIDGAFGNFAGFKEKLSECAMKVFGSGWAWLVMDNGKLVIESRPNQDAPIMGTSANKFPLLGLDVWEHAYYLKYQNRRADYVAAWFNVIDWDFIQLRWQQAKK